MLARFFNKTFQDKNSQSIAQANNQFAVALHRLLSEENGNVFFSPFSISVSMGMLLCAAEGETASELSSVLGHKQFGIKKVKAAAIFEQQICHLLQPNNTYILSCANSMLIHKSFEVKDQFKNIITKSFKALIFEVDIQKEHDKAVNLINNWVKEKTNNMIPKLVHSLDPSSVLILLNAVYFKGTWVKQFNREKTCAQKFYNGGVEENAKEVEMMHMRKKFPFYEEEFFQVLKLPYVGKEIAMMIILPREINGLDKVEAILAPSFVQDFTKKLWRPKVQISLPRFRLEYTKSLVPQLSELGIKRAFNAGAELTVASDSPNLAVSEILHRAVLEVNEEGSEASSVMSEEIVYYSLLGDPEPEFIADHPFMFVIYNEKTDLILFMGRLNEL